MGYCAAQETLVAISAGKRELDNLQRLLELAKAEDLGCGDVTGDLLPAELAAEGRFTARQPLVFCGGLFLHTIAEAYDASIRTDVKLPDGRKAQPGAVLATWAGPARAVLSAERVALNFLQRLSGIATVTAQYVQAVAGTGAAILDTRKTTPGWRDLEKYAVRAGGGRNHRRGLHDAILVKDNHLCALARGGEGDPIAALAGRLAAARKRLAPGAFVALEVDALDQLDAALRLPLDVILLDNMTPDQLRCAVARRDAAGLRGRLALEASGGINLANVRAVAETGVERISVGALTHSVRAADIALDLDLP
jgi:nicotinate-nucleotide pyrophosphorylase (carboxylating)